MKKQIAVLSLLISAMGWAQEDKPQTPKKEKEIKEVTITKRIVPRISGSKVAFR